MQLIVNKIADGWIRTAYLCIVSARSTNFATTAARGSMTFEAELRQQNQLAELQWDLIGRYFAIRQVLKVYLLCSLAHIVWQFCKRGQNLYFSGETCLG